MKKYLFYAIGEILLVIFGILIALQINNWNTNKHHLENLTKSLDQMHESLEADLVDLKRIISTHSNAAQGANSSIEHLIQQNEWTEELHDNIWKAQYNTSFRIKSSMFEAIKLNGLELIDNAALKLQLFEVYEEHSETIKMREAIIERTRADYYDRWIAKNILPDTSIKKYKVKDYNSILEDSEFLGNLNLLKKDHTTIIRDANRFALEILNLQAQISIASEQLKRGKAISFLQDKQAIIFSLGGYDQAKEVSLTGPLVWWQDQDYQLKKVNGQWQIEIELPPGHHLYQFLIDGVIQQDPENSNQLLQADVEESYFSVKYVPYQ